MTGVLGILRDGASADVQGVARRWEKPVLYHGTRYPSPILAWGVGYEMVSLTRCRRVAAYWAGVKRDDDEGCGAILVGLGQAADLLQDRAVPRPPAQDRGDH